MKKILFLFFLSIANISLAQKSKKPNIVLFLVDDMGVMDTSVPFLLDKNNKPISYPLNKWYKTPNMERLAKRGTRFCTFYAQSVCSPSRSSLITGQNATRHRTTQWIDPYKNNKGDFGPKEWNWKGIDAQDTNILPKLLQRNGYNTIYVGKAHLGPFGSVGENPKNLGYNVNIGGSAIGHPGSYLGMNNFAEKGKDGQVFQQVPNLEKYHQTNTFLTEALTLEAKAQIMKSIETSQPFFLQMAHYAVHTPFTFDPKFKPTSDTEKYSEEAQKYASLIAGMDNSLGVLMNQLDSLGIAENTLILFVGDNGSDAPLGSIHEIASSAPLRGKKGTHYEGGFRVPFIAAWAKSSPNNEWQKKLPIKQGMVQTNFGTIMDIYPTITELLSIKPSKTYPIDGISLKASLNNKMPNEKHNTFIMHFPHDHRSKYFTSYREGSWKLVYHYFPALNPANTRYELFNLENDPYEQVNLAKENQSKVKQLLFAMQKRLEKEGALYPEDKNGNMLKPQFYIDE
jgi:arylsulfatase A-like enzyme